MDTWLSWRIPISGDPRLLRLALAQVGLASVVAALVLLVAAPRGWVGPGLLGLIPLAIFMAYRRWSQYHQSLAGDDNVWIDDGGVHWLNSEGQEHSFQRAAIDGFHIGQDDETLRPVPALTLHLAGGFESQPIELHPPATPELLRELLGGGWKLAELPETSDTAQQSYDVSVAVYSECHEELHEWHWEGTKRELICVFAQFAAAASELPLPPPGARPAARIVLTSRRQPARLRLAHAPVAHLEPDLIAAPGNILHQISNRAADALSSMASETGNVHFDVSASAKDVWTFYLHVVMT